MANEFDKSGIADIFNITDEKAELTEYVSPENSPVGGSLEDEIEAIERGALRIGFKILRDNAFNSTEPSSQAMVARVLETMLRSTNNIKRLTAEQTNKPPADGVADGVVYRGSLADLVGAIKKS